MPPIEDDETETPAADTSKAEEISQSEIILADLEAEREKQISGLKQQLESLKAQTKSNEPSVEVQEKQLLRIQTRETIKRKKQTRIF